LLEFIRKRTRGVAKVRVYEPARPAGVGRATQTVIDIVNDDMPFLVDTVRGVLERSGSELHLLMHPILEVERDPAGELLGLRETAMPAPGLAESVMHISIGPVPAAQHGELEARIQAALDDVRATVTDFEAMRAVCAEQARTFRRSPLPDDESSSEIAEFLEWLCDRQFVFQGYAYVRFERAPLSVRPLPPGTRPLDDGAGVRFDRDRGLGILRDPLRSMFDVFEPPRKRELLRVLKANRHSTVHRTVHLDAIIISDLDARGTQFGAHMFVGLFTSAAYAAPPATIPVLHHKIERVIARSGFMPNSYNMRTLRFILETYPRNELFQTEDAELFSIALGIFHLQHRQRVALFVRRDPFGRFVSCLVYVPRDRMELELKRRIEDILAKAFNGVIAAYYPQLGDEPLARLHFIVKTPVGTPEKLDYVALERRIESATRTWKDRLAITLPAELGSEKGEQLIERYAEAFPAAYREDFDEVAAVSDIERIEQALDTGKLTLELYHPEASLPHELRFKVFSPNTYVAPSVVLPILENLGLRVVGEVPYEIEIPGARDTFWLHDFSLVTEEQVPVDLQLIRDSFYEVFSRTWEKRVDDDGFNKLVLHAGLTARQVALLRAYAKYLRQIQIPFSEGYMQQTLRKNAKITRGLVELFSSRFDPAGFEAQSAGRAGEHAASTEIASRVQRELDAVSSLDEDRILRAFLCVIQATTRTNFWQTDEGGLPKDHIAFKLDPSRLPDVPRPVPFREIFVSGPRVEGVHLRFGEVARGGLRWSDRLEDFRTEVLGLAKAQQVKNAVIVPVGSKGGFVVKRPPSADTGRDALRTEGVACYEIFVSSLLDLTDNRRMGAPNGGQPAPAGGAPTSDVIVAPPRTVRHDAPDPYLVVAADKGTATFSDIANRISQRRGFWLDDAFASGGSAGYDHKEMGITAKGAWECVKRHFRELGKDIQRADFTCIGVGDMSGDVFGNGMLLSQHIKLVAAFDHRHIFLDPSPDPAASWR
ncbi:MAG TPA: NAD-glutamate dehydrogenase domain-containing protein, partial [Polyangiaceae bacterium]|nr:NAD-glutamate dehydrogenase domain-containing protein [Polyangiaceae bacterium]